MSKLDDPIFLEESKHLSNTVAVIAQTKTVLEKIMEDIGAFNLDRLKEIRENPSSNSTDYMQFMNMLRSKIESLNVKDKYKQLEELLFLKKEPYFSRIDLEDPETKEIESHYIGKFGFSDKEKPLVLDWRAKASSIYYKYRYPQKDVKYDTPEGLVTMNLALKRTFEIDNSELMKYYNNDIKLDETEIIVDKIEDRTGGVLEDIVETIQENQHEIIEADPRKVCIVQGTVGSGKSTVAIHKLSYIFFNYPKLIRPERAILIAKNQILVGYLSTLFPKLGIFDINYGTIRDVIYKILFKEKINIEFDLALRQDTSDFKLDDIKAIKEKLVKSHAKYKKQLNAVFETEETEPFGGFVYDSNVAAYQNFSEALADIEEELRFQREFVKDNPHHPRHDKFKTNIKIMRRITKKLSAIRSTLRTVEMKNYIKEYELEKESIYGYKEALVYLIFFHELIGFKKYQKFEYAVLDEGQDFSVLEYAVLDKLVANGRFCILGDLNQSYAKEGLSQWEDIFEVIEDSKSAHKFTLDTNYRSTRPIIDFANRILSPYTDKYLPISINRRGVDPKVKTEATYNDVLDALSADLATDSKNLKKSIGIICMEDNYLEDVEQILDKLELPENALIKLNPADRIEYQPKSMYLTHFDNCKGLEFAKVYVVGLNLGEVRSFYDAKKAFVAVTRAMDELVVYSNE